MRYCLLRYCLHPTLILVGLIPTTAIGFVSGWEDRQDMYGQYFCYVDQAAGIKIPVIHSPTASNNLKPPESQMKFFIKLAPIVRTKEVQDFCLHSLRVYKEFF